VTRAARALGVVFGAMTWASVAAADEKAACTAAYVEAQSLRATHRLVEARERLRTCAQQECGAMMRGQMVADCTGWLAQVDAAVPSIVFEVRDAAGADVTRVRVTLDGQLLTDRLDGTALPADPGEHTFRFETAGQGPVEKKLVIREGDKGRREAVTFATSAPPSGAEALTPAPPPTAPPGDDGRGQRLAGVVTGGVGLAGLAVGGIFGGLTISAWSHVNAECPSLAGCSAEAQSNHASAVTFGTVSTVSFIAGGALLAGGLTLYLVAPKGRSPSVGIWVAREGLGMAGRF